MAHHHVPADQNTFQARINTAKNRDLVFVATCTYYKNIGVNGKTDTMAASAVR